MTSARPWVPKYRQLAELIRDRIADGTYAPDLPLPSEQQLMQETEYGRDTVRAAVKVLRDASWVRVTHGLGTFACPPEERKDF